nr:ASCH domain-containing protein [Vibrio intestinalis]
MSVLDLSQLVKSVLDWAKNPVCIVKITNVDFCPFGQVSREFAESEGEGDGTYEWWYKAHNDFFIEDCKSSYGIEFNESTELVLVTFKLVHK